MSTEDDQLRFKSLSYGFLNPVADPRTGNSADRRRSNTMDFLRAAIDQTYSSEALKGVHEFRGIVMQVSSKAAGAAGDREYVLNKYAKRGMVERWWESAKSLFADEERPVYKVLIPELECRPVPYGFDDPIIATYYDVYLDQKLETWSATKPELGSLVTVRFSNTANFQDPRIIRVGETIAFHSLSPTGNASAHNSGRSRPAGANSPGPDQAERVPNSQPGGSGPAPRPATVRNVCRDAVTGYTPGPNAEDLRAWMRSKPVKEKDKQKGGFDDGPQLDNGGDITSDLVNFAKSFLQDVIDEVPLRLPIRISAGNDAYHHCPPSSGRSRHCYGLALDICIDEASKRDAVESILYEYSAGTNGKVLFKNEYKRAQGGRTTTGGHFHIQLGGSKRGWLKRNYDTAKAKVAAGTLTGKTYA